MDGVIKNALGGLAEPTRSERRRFDPDSSAQAHHTIPVPICNRPVSLPHCEFVRLYGRPGKKHRFASWSESNKTGKPGRLVQRRSERPIMRPCLMGGLGHTFKCLGGNAGLGQTGWKQGPHTHPAVTIARRKYR